LVRRSGHRPAASKDRHGTGQEEEEEEEEDRPQGERIAGHELPAVLTKESRPPLATHQIGAAQKRAVVNAAIRHPHCGRSGERDIHSTAGTTQIIWCVHVTGEIRGPVVAHSPTPRNDDQC